MIPSIKGIVFLGVTLKFLCPVERNLYDLGSVTLKCDEREFTLDVCASKMNLDEDEIECQVEVDTEVFPVNEYKYDLTAVDLISGNTKGTLYIGDEYHEAPESITLFVKFGEMTKAIELEIE